MKFKKKPVVIEAIQWKGDNTNQIRDFVGDSLTKFEYSGNYIGIETLEGTMRADINDYIIKGVKGEFYPCKPDIFEQTYDKVEQEKVEKMRKVDIGTSRFTEVFATDERGAGNANHEYDVYSATPEGSTIVNEERFAFIRFQNGPIKENGVNGCHNEDLIAVVIDRLQGFQAGEFSCRENAIAITKLEEALLWLNKRTQDRIRRGVEGTNIK